MGYAIIASGVENMEQMYQLKDVNIYLDQLSGEFYVAVCSKKPTYREDPFVRDGRKNEVCCICL